MREWQNLFQPLTYKRNLCLSDIHGCFYLLKELIENVIRFDYKEDRLIFLGDYIDLSTQSMKVVLYLQILKEMYPDNVILLLGNHEEMAYRFLTQPEHQLSIRDKYLRHWVRNGGQATLDSFGGEKPARKILVPFIESLIPYYETDTHIFVHGGIPAGTYNIRNAPVHDLIWEREFDYEGTKTLVVGHRPHQQVRKLRNIICVDTGAYWYGKLSAYDTLNNVSYEVANKPREKCIGDKL